VIMRILSYENLIDPVLRDIRLDVIDFAGMKAGQTVLDVCCGTGAQVIEYSKKGLIATGIDLEEEMLAAAYKNKHKLGLENASFYQGDATSMPFNDHSFDYVSISFALHDKEKSNRDKIVDEMKRVVKRQGYLLLIDFSIPLPRNIWGVASRMVEFGAGGSHYQGFRNYSLEGGINSILESHGLNCVKTKHLKSGIVTVTKASILADGL